MYDATSIDLEKIGVSKVTRPITHIILHHSATVDGRTYSWPAIKKYHMDKGWKDIGYNLGIELVEDTVKVLYGRPLTMNGAHCKEDGMNSKSVGVCVVGCYDEKAPPEDHWTQVLRVVRKVQECFLIPIKNVHGHHEYAPKTCPGKMFDMYKFRRDLLVRPIANDILTGTLNIAGAVYDVEMKLRKIG